MASRVVEYILQIADRGSGTLSKVTRESKATASGMSGVTKQSKAIDAAAKSTTGSLGGLRKKLDDLKKQKEWIDPKNINHIKSANREIEGLEKQISKLDRAGRKSGGIKNLFSEIGGSVAGLATSPIAVASAAIGYGGKLGMSLDEGIAKINVTAELDPKGRKQLERDIKEIARRNKFDVTLAPDAFEQIISQVGDVDLTKDIFEQTIRGSKAGFTELSTVAGALARSLSIVGKENATAGEILDTFFMAKKVGAGEFADFATYMPGLIASADALGVKYKEVAGLYAYMTGKGQSPEKAAVLMDNMFSALGRGDIVDEMNARGIRTHDKKGKILPMTEIFGSMDAKMSTMSDRSRSQFLEGIGINRLENKKAFMVMVADNEKLVQSINEVANAAGATDAALGYSRNSVQQAGEVWAIFKGHMAELGTALLPAITGGLTVLGGIVDVLAVAVGGAMSFFGGWYDELADGNPLIWGLTAALGAAGLMLAAHTIKLKAVAMWKVIATAATGAFSKAMNTANASLLASPWGWALVGVAALVTGIAVLSSKTDKATKSFARFNAETRTAKKDANDYFAAAMNAAEGSDARAIAIKHINEQYGTYLPSLLTEKTTNEELRGALNLVNVELERKLKLKYRDQLLEGASNALQDAETYLYDNILSGVDNPAQQEQLAKGISDILGSLIGEFSVDDVYSRLSDLLANTTGHGIYEAAKGRINYALKEYSKERSLYDNTVSVANARFGTITPSNVGGISTALETATATTTTTTVNGSGTGTGNGKGTGGSKSEWLDLDRFEGVNEKGSSTYGAIMSKIGRVRLAGLAASVAVAASAPFGGQLPDTTPQGTVMPSLAGDGTNYNDRKTLSLDKFCDKIEIHIANADGKGYDQVRREIIDVLKEVADGRV